MSVRWSTLTKGIVIVGLLLAGVWLLSRFHALLAPLITALLVAYLLNLPVNLLIRRTGMSRTVATLLVFVVTGLALATLIALISPRVVEQVRVLQIDLRAVQDALERFAAQPVEIYSLRLNPETMLDQALAALRSIVSPVATSALSLVAGAAQTLAWSLFVAVIAFLLVKDTNQLIPGLVNAIPPPLQADVYRLGGELGGMWNAFLRGRLVLSFVIFVLFSIVLSLIGMPSAIAIGAITGLLAFIPSIGSVLAGILAALIALARGSNFLPISNLGFALLVTAIYVGLFQIESLYLLPRFVGRRVHLHPLVVIVGSVAGALVGGVLGLLLAAPVIASTRVLLGYVYNKLLDQDPFPPKEVALQRVAAEPRGQIRGRPVEAVLFDLDGTLVETDDWVVANLAERLQRVRVLLPEGDAQRVARRLIMWSHDRIAGWLETLDRVGLDPVVQRMARQIGILNSSNGEQALKPVAGTAELIHNLEGRYKLGIVSSRRQEEITDYLTQQGLNGQIQIVAGSDTTEHSKPHPQPLLWAAEQLAVPLEHVVMVGDTIGDLRAAKAAGALAVAVLCGFGEREDFDEADLVLDTTADLAALL